MTKKITLSVIFLLLGITATGCATTSSTPTTSDGIHVVASFYPLAHFAQQVGGNHIEVTTITPAGVEAHDFEPSARDIAAIQNADVFLFHGAGLDPWAEKIQSDLKSQGVSVVHMTDYFTLSTHAGGESDGGDNGQSQFDPHIWLDPVLAKKEVEIIRDAFIQIDSDNKSEYTKNAAEYIAQLEQLDTEYKETLASCRTRDIIVSHDAFHYLADRYNITTIPISGLNPENEPTPRQLAEISQLAEEKQIHYIFFETLVSPKLAETIANEIGAQTLVLNPVEGLTTEEIEKGKTYVSVMKENLSHLSQAMECN